MANFIRKLIIDGQILVKSVIRVFFLFFATLLKKCRLKSKTIFKKGPLDFPAKYFDSSTIHISEWSPPSFMVATIRPADFFLT